MKYTAVGVDIAKNVFQLHWVDAEAVDGVVCSLDAGPLMGVLPHLSRGRRGRKTPKRGRKRTRYYRKRNIFDTTRADVMSAQASQRRQNRNVCIRSMLCRNSRSSCTTSSAAGSSRASAAACPAHCAP